MAPHFARLLDRTGRTALAIACALAASFVLACGGGDEPADEAASEPVVEQQGTREVTLPGTEDDPVKAVLAAGELPEGYPADIPPPPDAEPKNAMVIPNQGGLVTFLSESSRADVFAHFKKELAGQGWNLETEEDSLRSMIRATKSGRKANVTVAKGANGTEIAVTFEGS